MMISAKYSYYLIVIAVIISVPRVVSTGIRNINRVIASRQLNGCLSKENRDVFALKEQHNSPI